MARKKADEDSLVDERAVGLGHNSMTVPADELVKICEALEQINVEKQIAADNFKAAMDVAKEKGFDPKHIREALKLRAMDKEKRDVFLQTRDLYLNALEIV